MVISVSATLEIVKDRGSAWAAGGHAPSTAAKGAVGEGSVYLLCLYGPHAGV